MSKIDKILELGIEIRKDPGNRTLIKYAGKLMTKIIRKWHNHTATTKCRKCGTCCRGFVVGITAVDLQREPRLQKFIIPSTTEDFEKRTTMADEIWKIPIGTTYSECPFLKRDGNRFYCDIYKTRPTTCEKFVPSNFACHCAMLSGKGVQFPDTIEVLAAGGWPMPIIVGKLMESTGDVEHDAKIGIEYKWKFPT